MALGWTLGEERFLTVASPLRFALGIEVGAVVCHRTYRPTGFLAVKQESLPERRADSLPSGEPEMSLGRP